MMEFVFVAITCVAVLYVVGVVLYLVGVARNHVDLAGLGVVVVGLGFAVAAVTVVVGLFGATLLAVLGFLGEVIVGVVVGGGVIAVVGFLLLGVVSVVVEIGERRNAQDPAHLRAIPPLAPRTLRWVCGLLPSDEGAAWLAEVTSCLAEEHDKVERRRYVRSYRRGVPQLIWTSWAVHFGGSRSRTLS